MSDELIPIRINTLREDELVTFDVFVKVGQRYLHHTNEHDSVEGTRLQNLRNKGVRKLFIHNRNEGAYLSYLETGLKGLNRTDIATSKKAALAHDTMVSAAENAERMLETEDGFNTQKSQMKLIGEFFKSDKAALKEILLKAGISVDTNHHAATVSSLALAMANKTGGMTDDEKFELAFAGLLHDFGKARFKFDPMKPVSQLTPQERKSYENHPQDGADMLAGKPFISPRILGLIASHEERGLGRGFPERKHIGQLALPYQILSVVNCFDHFCGEKGIQPLQAIDLFYEEFSKDYSDELITNLATVLN